MAETKTTPAAPKVAPAAKPAAAKKGTASSASKTKTATAPKATAASKPAAGKKTPAAKKVPAAKKSAVLQWNPGNEERYNMVQVAAYYLAECDSFAGNPIEYWSAAELHISGMLPKK